MNSPPRWGGVSLRRDYPIAMTRTSPDNAPAAGSRPSPGAASLNLRFRVDSSSAAGARCGRDIGRTAAAVIPALAAAHVARSNGRAPDWPRVMHNTPADFGGLSWRNLSRQAASSKSCAGQARFTVGGLGLSFQMPNGAVKPCETVRSGPGNKRSPQGIAARPCPGAGRGSPRHPVTTPAHPRSRAHGQGSPHAVPKTVPLRQRLARRR